jgi:hypothetical protein
MEYNRGIEAYKKEKGRKIYDKVLDKTGDIGYDIDMENKETTILYARIPKGLHTMIKMYAAEIQTHIQEIVYEILENYFKKMYMELHGNEQTIIYKILNNYFKDENKNVEEN